MSGLILLLALIGFLFVILVGWLYLAFFILKSIEKKKTIRFCNQKGIKYVKDATSLPIGDDFNLVNIEKGEKRKFQNLMVGEENGIPFILGEYDFKIQKGNDFNLITATFCVMNDNNLIFPNFFLQKKDIVNLYYTSIASKFMVGEEIILENNKDSTSNFIIRSDSSDRVKAFFNNEIINVFNSYFPDNCVCEAKNGTIMIYNNTHLDIESKIKLLYESIEFFNSFKSALIKN